jgi:hypothetical protein
MTKKHILYLAIAITLLSLTGVLSVAAAGISDVSPKDGTVGTAVTISGSGFGAKAGQVQLGDEPCKVVTWSDTRIVCTVSRPQIAGLYTITVTPQGAPKSSEPMTFSSFTIRDPEIAPGELARDGDTVTITGAFFGDTKGLVRIAYRENGVVVDKAKVVDWSMNAIRIQLPAGLTGRFIVKVQNAIGKDYALFDLGDGPPTLVGMVWPTGYGKFDSSDNARGIWYNGKLWVWSIWWTPDTYKQMTSDNMYRIQYRTFQNGQLSGASQLWGGETYAEPAPILVQYPNGGPEKMFVFHTGKNGNIYFTRLNGTVWEDGKWIKIVDPATGGIPTTKMDGWEVAPAYNPETHRLYVYYAKDYNDYLHYAYSDDFGTTWHAPGLAPNSPIIKAAPSAIFYKPASGTTDVLLAMKDVNQKIRLCKFAGGTYVSSEVLATPTTDNINGYGRPFLTEVGNGKIALMYGAEHGDQTYCSDYFIPHIVVMDRATGQWGTPYQATTLPDLGVAQGEYQFYWQPNGALDPTTNTFWLFYGFELCAMYTDTTNNGPWWMFTSIATPGAAAGGSQVVLGASETARDCTLCTV